MLSATGGEPLKPAPHKRRSSRRLATSQTVVVDIGGPAGQQRLDARLVNLSKHGAAIHHTLFQDKTVLKQLRHYKVQVNGHSGAFVPWRASRPAGEVGIRFDSQLSLDALSVLVATNSLPAHDEIYRPKSVEDLKNFIAKLWDPARELPLPLENICIRVMSFPSIVCQVFHHYDDRHYHDEFLRIYNQVYDQIAPCKRLFFYSEAGRRIDGPLAVVVVLPHPTFDEVGRPVAQVGHFLTAAKLVESVLPDAMAYHGLGCDAIAYANGTKLHLRTFPFFAQDGVASRCAHAALHVLSRYLHRHLNMHELSIDQIRRIGQPFDHATLPVAGLSPHTVLACLDKMGATPVAYQMVNRTDGVHIAEATLLDNFSEALDVLHAYLDSQLPILLAVRDAVKYSQGQRHALVAVGHTVTRRQNQALAAEFSKEPGRVRFRTGSTYLQHIVVHDDAIGPLLLLPVAAADRVESEVKPHAYSMEWNLTIEQNLDEFYVPLPFGVHLRAEDVTTLLANLIPNLGARYKQYPTTSIDADVHSALMDGTVIVTPYLDFRQRVLRNVCNVRALRSEGTAAILCTLHLPRHLWVIELSTPARRNTGTNHQQVVGFILLDATAPPGVRPPLIAWRLPGQVAWMNERGQKGAQYLFAQASHLTYPLLLYANYDDAGVSINHLGQRKRSVSRPGAQLVKRHIK